MPPGHQLAAYCSCTWTPYFLTFASPFLWHIRLSFSCPLYVFSASRSHVCSTVECAAGYILMARCSCSLHIQMALELVLSRGPASQTYPPPASQAVQDARPADSVVPGHKQWLVKHSLLPAWPGLLVKQLLHASAPPTAQVQLHCKFLETFQHLATMMQAWCLFSLQ